MTIDLRRIETATIQARLTGWPRIIPAAHAATPADTGFGTSRFSSATHGFRTLYAAQDFGSAFAEAVVRDRFVGKQRRYLYRPALEGLMVTEISSAPLRLLDLRGQAAYDLGIDSDAKGARAHGAGRDLADTIHRQTMIDGILYHSRLSDRDCVAIFDRAFGRLRASTPIPLVTVAALTTEIERLKIVVRRRYGMPSTG